MYHISSNLICPESKSSLGLECLHWTLDDGRPKEIFFCSAPDNKTCRLISHDSKVQLVDQKYCPNDGLRKIAWVANIRWMI